MLRGAGAYLRHGLPVVAGVIAGVATSLLVARARLPDDRAAGTPAREHHADALRSPGPPPDGSPSQGKRAPATPEEFEAAVAEHRAEPLDPAWGPKASQSFVDDLGRLAVEHGFLVQEVDCRNVTCLVITRWRDYDEAHNHAEVLVHEPFTVNCLRFLSRPPVEDPSLPYVAKVLYDCSSTERAVAAGAR